MITETTEFGYAFRDSTGQLHVYTREEFIGQSEHVLMTEGEELSTKRRDRQRTYSWNEKSRK